jgi:hypothetical protein
MEKDFEKDIEKQLGTVIQGDFPAAKEQIDEPVKTFKNQSNPIYKGLVRFTHTSLSGNKDNYKSVSRFKPEDLR